MGYCHVDLFHNVVSYYTERHIILDFSFPSAIASCLSHNSLSSVVVSFLDYTSIVCQECVQEWGYCTVQIKSKDAGFT